MSFEWEPIDTAPKDGTVILLKDNEGAGKIWAAAWRHSNSRFVLFDRHGEPNWFVGNRDLSWCPMPRFEGGGS
jgi:hypothetical protein